MSAKKVSKWEQLKSELPKNYAKQIADKVDVFFEENAEMAMLSEFVRLSKRQVLLVFSGEITDIKKVNTVRHFAEELREDFRVVREMNEVV